MNNAIRRREFLAVAGAGLLVSGCNSSNFDTMTTSGIDRMSTGSIGAHQIRPAIGVDANLRSAGKMYGEIRDGEHLLAAVPHDKMDPRFRRQRVVNKTGMPPGTIVVSPHQHHAWYVLSNDEAVRYGVGVGKAGFEWQGDAVIARKAQWPRWTPPAEMIQRRPDLVKFAGGQEGGIDNPLGARALYLFADGRDTLYRLHGTPEWDSIGKSMSSGCIRFLNQDIIDLYNRVPNGTRVRVI
ncbi:lipoprotein [Ahrensia sp. R2A130]|nr:lipoprotein [Ahrensia sp. R2A130]